MAYSEFTLERIEERFGIGNRIATLFDQIEPLHPSERLKADLEEAPDFLLRTEKAKSEWIVVPILRELKRRNRDFLAVYSGENLEGDSSVGLNGECDFILAKEVHSYSISYPVIQLVEAKKQDFDLGIPQCAAQLIGAALFNQKRNVILDKIYGCVTTGSNWQFLALENKTIYIDPKLYALDDVARILGIFQQIINYYKQTLPD
jgi:hypothetical protein